MTTSFFIASHETTATPMVSSSSKSQPRPDTNFAYEGIAVHPDHGLPFLEDDDEEELHITAEQGEHSDEDEAQEEGDMLPPLEELMLEPPTLWSRGSHSSAGSSGDHLAHDYFSFSPRSSISSFFDAADVSPPSSTASTPTHEYFPKAAFSDSSTSVNFPFAHVNWSGPTTSEKSPSTPTRVHPYARPKSPTTPSPPRAPGVHASGASMIRLYSMPVETQSGMDARLLHRHAMASAMSKHAPAVVRSKSSGAGPAWTARSGSLPTSSLTSRFDDQTKMTRPPQVQLAFGANWGATLPTRQPEAIVSIPYPYNLAIPLSPPRVPRSYSTTDIPTHHAPAPQQPQSSSEASSFSAHSRSMNRLRRTLGPMTPLIHSAKEGVELSPGGRARIQRGLSF